MTDKIRTVIDQHLKENGISRAQLARDTDMKLPNLSRILNGRSGSIPETWQRILDTLGLELVAVPKGADTSQLWQDKEGE